MQTKNTYPTDATDTLLWKTDPAAWLDLELSGLQRGEQCQVAYASLSALLRMDPKDFFEPAEVSTNDYATVRAHAQELFLALLEATKSKLHYFTDRKTYFLDYGDIFIPACPAGFKLLGELKSRAQEYTTKPVHLLADPDSTLGQTASALYPAGVSALFRGIRTYIRTDAPGVRLQLCLEPEAINNLPKPGDKLPMPILSVDLDGLEVSGDDVLQCAEKNSWCFSGVSDFLNHFGIEFETEGGSYECDSCGRDSEEGEPEEFSHIEDFTLDHKMVRALERDGYADDVRAFLEQDNPTSWAELLENNSDAELLSEHKPDSAKGWTYDPERWIFAPDFDALAAEDDSDLSDLDFESMARALPLLTRIADAHQSAGVLPPIAGTLTMRQKYPSTDKDPIAFRWDYGSGILSHAIGSRARIEQDKQGNLKLYIDGKWAPIDRNSGAFSVHADASALGPKPGRWVKLAQGKASM